MIVRGLQIVSEERRTKGKYSISTFGKIVFNSLQKILEHFCDALEVSYSSFAVEGVV
jgi:hypothetical protein